MSGTFHLCPDDLKAAVALFVAHKFGTVDSMHRIKTDVQFQDEDGNTIPCPDFVTANWTLIDD